MNDVIREKFEKLGANLGQNGSVSFEEGIQPGESIVSQTLSSAERVLCDLSDLAIVDVRGPDATEFFQAQVCNDVTLLDQHTSQINGYCTPKGRLLAVFLVVPIDDGYRLVLPASVADAFSKRLSMFVLRANVTVTRNDDVSLLGVGLTGKLADNAANGSGASLPGYLQSLPDTVLQLKRSDDVCTVRWHDAFLTTSTTQRYIVMGPADELCKSWDTDGFAHASGTYWRLGDITAGVPSVVESSMEQFIPQMLNMQLMDGLSFKKGCYPGQEIVARMHYLGKLKKHMKRMALPLTNATALSADDIPKAGDVLATENNNNAGQVVDAVLVRGVPVAGNETSGSASTDTEPDTTLNALPTGATLHLLTVVNKEVVAEDIKMSHGVLQLSDLPYDLTPADAPS